MERSPCSHSELKLSTLEMRRESSSHLLLLKGSALKITFPEFPNRSGSRAEITKHRGFRPCLS